MLIILNNIVKGFRPFKINKYNLMKIQAKIVFQ